jgi:hypothetical protein
MNRLKAEEDEIKKRGTIAHIMNERDAAAEAYLLFRGEYDKRRDKVAPETPAALPAMPADLPHNRLGLAQWLLRPENPLTARVTVNRFWYELFGAGIVRTAGDFGIAGEMPSHPELLDWLAVEFRESGWDVKKLFKLLVTSATYRQAANTTKAKLTKDPENRLLSRGPRFRMDAEMVRDYALASSGLLVPALGGPSVKPYQPDGVWEAVAMPNSDTSKYARDTGEKLYRRSLYTFWKRSAPPAQMEIFNAPSRETCTVRRDRTDTPLQALVTLNDEQFIEAARNLAQQALKDGGAKDAERLDFMARRLLARTFRPAERRVVESTLKDLLAHYQAETEAAEKLIAVEAGDPRVGHDRSGGRAHRGRRRVRRRRGIEQLGRRWWRRRGGHGRPDHQDGVQSVLREDEGGRAGRGRQEQRQAPHRLRQVRHGQPEPGHGDREHDDAGRQGDPRRPG